MSLDLRCLRRALALGGLMTGFGLLATGPAAASGVGIDVTVPTLPPTTLPLTTLPPVPSDPVSPVAGLPDSAGAIDLTPGGVTGAAADAATTVTGQTGAAVATVTGIVDPALGSILASVEGILDLLNGTVHGLFPGSVPVSVPAIPGHGSAESSRSSGDSGAAVSDGASAQPGASAAGTGRDGVSAAGSASTGSAPSTRSLASLRRAALRAGRDFALPFTLGLLALGYLIFQSRTERHEPRLATDSEEELLRFR